MRDDPSVVALVTRAAGSDRGAWDELVERYGPMVWSICTRYRLSSHDIEDVGQNVWLRLVEQLGNLREPAALPGWLATTTQRECLRVLRRQERLLGAADDLERLGPDDVVVEEEIIAAERNAALRAAFAELPSRCRQLLSMLISDPPSSYAQISAVLQIPVGSIGPQRARCLERLRRSAHLSEFAEGEITGTHANTPGGEPRA
jgi:RNA polymerase sigma factor (sigma-70 family)